MKKEFIFKTSDSDLKYRTGTKCIVIRSLTEKEADIDEVGKMYKIRFSDGFETDAFEDELF